MQQNQDYQYLVFPLSDDLFNSGLPESSFEEHVENGIKTLINRIGTSGNHKRKLAFMVSILGWATDNIPAQQLIEAAVNAAIKNDVAIYFFIPSTTGWQKRPDLWNYNDPNSTGYNPNNKNNVEWSDWRGSAYPHEYRDWGTPEELPPSMCYNCPVIKSEIRTIVINKILPILLKAVKKLADNNKAYLFAGVTIGDEQMLYNYEYTDSVNVALGQFMLANGAPKIRIGFNALTQKGFSQTNPPQDFANVLAEVNMEFVAYWCKLLNDGGVPANKIYTHIAAAAGYDGTPFLKFSNAPLRTAFNNYSRPGFTTYITGNPNDLSLIYAELGRQGISNWGATEANPYFAGNLDPELYLNMHFKHGASVMVLNFGTTSSSFTNKLYDGVYGTNAIKAYNNFLSDK